MSTGTENVHEWQAKYRIIERSYIELQGKLKFLADENQKLNSAFQIKERENSLLQNKVLVLENQHNQSGDISMWQAQVAALTTDKESWMKLYDDTRKECDNLRLQTSPLQAQVTYYSSETDKWSKLYEEARRECDLLKVQATKNSDLEDQVSQEIEKLKSIVAQYSDYSDVKSKYVTALQEKEQFFGMYEDLKTEYGNYKITVDSVLSEPNPKVVELTEENTTLRKLVNQLQELTAYAQNYEKTVQERDVFKKAYDEKAKELDRVNIGISTYTPEFNILRMRSAQFEEKIKAYQAEYDRLTNNAEVLGSQLNAKSTEVEELKQSSAEMSNELKSLTVRNNQLTQIMLEKEDSIKTVFPKAKEQQKSSQNLSILLGAVIAVTIFMETFRFVTASNPVCP
jgi:chromosome segregation ATPase